MLIVLATACGGSGDPPRPTADETPEDEREAQEQPQSERLPEGTPMPVAEDAGGIPPYPNAMAFTRLTMPDGLQAVHSFTPDPWLEVADFYSEHLPEWERLDGGDMVIFKKEPDQAAVTVSPVEEYDGFTSSSPEVLRTARTSIGISWR
jgi:hypothetical protein